MKTWKKISALLLSFGMLLSLLAAVPVSAAAPDPTEGSITVHKFEVKTEQDYEAMKKNVNKSGAEIDISSHETLKNLRPMKDIQFTLTRVEEPEGTVVDPENPTPMKGENAYSKTFSTNDQGVVTFSGLELGLYQLKELPDGRVKTPMDPVLISVPTYNQEFKNPDKGSEVKEFNYDIHVYPKNLIYSDGPDINKDVVVEGNNDATVDIEEEFDWIILTDVPKDINENITEDQFAKMYYRILDTLDLKLDFVKTKSVIIRSKDKETQMELQKDDGYTFKRTNAQGADDPNGRNLKWELTTKSIKAMKDYVEGKVVITFTTKLNETAKDFLGQAIENQGELEYKNASDVEYNPVSDKPEVHTGGIKIKKVDKTDGTTPLKGAKFIIYSNEKDAKADNREKAVKRNDQIYEVESNEKGMVSFDGLKYTADGAASGEAVKPNAGSKDYWIVETEAPTLLDGTKYNRLKDPFKVTVTATSHTEPVKGWTTVYNAKDNYELPFTGGTGLLVFLGGGAALLAVAYLISKSGKNKTAK